MSRTIKERLKKVGHVLYRNLCILRGQPSFVHRSNHPVQADMFDFNKGFRGWVSSRSQVIGFELNSPSMSDKKVRRVIRLDVEWAMSYRYPCHVGYESDIPLKDWLKGRDAETVTLTVQFESGSTETIPLSLTIDQARKDAKRLKLLPLLSCPECHSPLRQEARSLACQKCGKAYPLERSSVNFLTQGFIQEFSIESTHNVSAWDYDTRIAEIIQKNPDKLYLDCGAGFRKTCYDNVINYEIVDYSSTDILGVGERLPFADNSLDGVFSIAVMEHVKDPFLCAREIVRVLKPGGVLFCAAPFLQPVHGYPHHYYNMTAQGLANLFPSLDVKEVYVPLSLHPIQAIRWILFSYAQGLPDDLRLKFESMTVRNIFDLPSFDQFYVRDFPLVHRLDPKKWSEVAAGNCLIAYKR